MSGVPGDVKRVVIVPLYKSKSNEGIYINCQVSQVSSTRIIYSQ